MAKINKENKVVTNLRANPDEKHWEAFRRYLLKTKAKYYKVFYPRKLKKKEDMYAAYVIIYDPKYIPMFRIPVIMKTKKSTQGATIYFKELLNTNKDYKEWVA